MSPNSEYDQVKLKPEATAVLRAFADIWKGKARLNGRKGNLTLSAFIIENIPKIPGLNGNGNH